MASYVESFAAKMDWGKPFQRTGKLPLDRSSIFSSYDDAVLYASGVKDADSRKLAPSSYVGQIITVYEEGVVTVYKIEEDRSLAEVGRATEGDGKSITLDNGILSLFGFDSATEGQQPRIVNKGTAEAPDLQLEWYTPDNSTVSGLQESVGTLQETVGDSTKGLVKDVADLKTVKANAADVYTKTEADGLLDKKANASEVYTKTEADGLLDKKANADNVYTKDQVYTKTEADGLLDKKANAADVYTKTEIDGKLTGALHYKGTYASFAELTAAVEAGTITPATGDVWNITAAGGTDASGIAIEAGDNVIYNGTGWDVSSSAIDLSGYYTKDQVYTKTEADGLLDKKANSADVYTKTEADGLLNAKANASEVYTKTEADGLLDKKANASEVYTKTEANGLLDKKVDVEDGKRLMTDVEGERLAELVKVEASETNGHIKLDGTDTKVYELPTASDSVVGGVKGSADKDKVAVNADGTMGLNQVSGSKIDGAVAEASKVTNKLTIGAKDYDGSAPVEITAEDIPLPTSVVHKGDIATTEAVGVVKSNAAQDGVSVDSDGKMVINDISASKVKGAVSEASKVTNKLTAGSKSFDGSAPVEITAEDLGAMKTADMGDYVKFENVATTAKAGVVKSSTAQDKVLVDADGVMTVNDISASKVIGTVSKAADAEKLGGVASGDILDGTSGKVKSAAAADKLATARNISVSGDATGTASFDGTGDAEIAVTLKNVGNAGTYTKVTTDAQGRVTGGEQLAASDIPELTLAKISDAGSLAGLSEVAYANLNADMKARIDELERVDHEHDNKAVIDGITSAKVTAWDETAGKIDGKADKATTLSGYGITDAYTKNEIDAKVAGAYHFMGTYPTFADLIAAVEAGTIAPQAGYVYNITTGGGTDMNGTTIKSGDNVAYVTGNTTGWDCLGGIMDLSAYSTTEQIQAKLDLKAEKETVNGINDRLGKVETTVGDASNGLVKTVGEHTTKLGTLDTDVTNLKNTVGDDSKGLVKSVAANTAAIEKLNGDENTDGSVRKLVAASANTINNTINDITKDGGTIDTKVSAAVSTHNTATDAHADLFAAKQNKVAYTTMTFEPADFVENTDGGAPYKATKTVAGLDAAKSYAPNITPDVASCNIITAAGFYPTAVVDAGTLTLYCRTAPTAAIVVSGTFTEIQ